MDYKQKCEYLAKYKRLDKYIDTLIEEKRRVQDRILNISPHISCGSQKTDISDKTASCALRLYEFEKQIDAAVDRYCDMRQEITALINNLEIPEQRQVVYLKYICGMNLEEIAEKLNYCARQVQRIHKSAIDNLCISAVTEPACA